MIPKYSKSIELIARQHCVSSPPSIIKSRTPRWILDFVFVSKEFPSLRVKIREPVGFWVTKSHAARWISVNGLFIVAAFQSVGVWRLRKIEGRSGKRRWRRSASAVASLSLSLLGHFKRLYEFRLLTRPWKQVRPFFRCLLSSYLRDLRRASA